MTLAAMLFVGTGSAVGAASRYAIGQGIAKVNRSDFPWGTWIVNMAGTFLLGLIFQEFSVIHHNHNAWLLLGTGFCGAFTTFSTMSIEVVNLFRKRLFLGMLYLSTSLVLGFVLAWVPQWWMP
ncbi:fluoride efflux transporter CrcB [Alicyclobacillus tolerans]|uniref:fluoride efflux transporter CrcB n=1 Tax=Alicyclobacillus tolerans TaxID=90970 RepID=UPI001EFFBD78|nr:fluoride efflux transporter CrcB [Alicyclobacillus tolerans]MCF8566059.1 fluoride efflux transporter CrcB [Alicyclobacillus tolerans]